jgi:hypothetical protein
MRKIRYSSVFIATGYGLDGRGSIPDMDRDFAYPAPSRPALGPTQPPVQWVPGALSLGVNGRVVKLTTHLHLVPRSRMVELYLHSPIPYVWN